MLAVFLASIALKVTFLFKNSVSLVRGCAILPFQYWLFGYKMPFLSESGKMALSVKKIGGQVLAFCHRRDDATFHGQYLLKLMEVMQLCFHKRGAFQRHFL